MQTARIQYARMAGLSVVHSVGLIEPSSPVPLYFQIANVVQARIFAGTLQGGAPIGTEKDLAAQFGVSRMTVRKALEVLRAEGLLKVERGRGTFVADSPRPVAPTALHLFLDDILARGETLEVIREEQGEVAATPAVARAFNIGVGTKVVRVKQQMRPVDGHASGTCIWLTYFLTRQTWRLLLPIERGPLLEQLDRAPGLRLAQGHEVIEAIAADVETAAWLEVAPGSPVLRRQREYQTASGRTVVFGWVDRTTGAIPVLLSRTER
jgi:GntR family transcriptional regulator, N-acetylglucosamine utilization regulator